MARDKELLAAALDDAMSAAPDNRKDAMSILAGVIIDHFVENLDVSIPATAVVTRVTGQAVGTPNAKSIACEVK